MWGHGYFPCPHIALIRLLKPAPKRPSIWIAWLAGFLAWAGLLLAAPACAAALIQATPDRNPVRLQESFNLVFSSDEAPDGEPDFSPLEKDFEMQGQSQSSQISINNGGMSKQQQWTLQLMPKRAGTLLIPAIAFGADHSAASTLTVLDGASPSANNEEQALFMEVEATPKNPYVQAQVIYTVRVLYRVGLLGGDLPDPAIADALIQRLGDDRKYSAQRQGQQYAVLERQYALFPQKSGLLKLPPMRLEAQIETGARSFFSRAVRVEQVQSPALDLQVRPIPAAFTGAHWLPAARLKLEESWSQNPPHGKAGEPLTRTLTLRADGVTVGVLPELAANQTLDAAIKPYPDQPVLKEDKSGNGLSSLRQEKIALMPSKAGVFQVPELTIPWWNTQADRLEIAKIPASTLSVEAAAGDTATPPPQAAPPAPEQANAPLPAAQSMAAPAQIPLQANLWFWISLLLGSAWLATALWTAKLLRGRKPAAAQPSDAEPIRKRAARKALRQACRAHDPAAARPALLAWAQAQWPQAAVLTLVEVGRLGGAALAEEIEALNRALYGEHPSAWQGDGLWNAAQACEQATAKPPADSVLAPLYPS
jgi:hypothetical protein